MFFAVFTVSQRVYITTCGPVDAVHGSETDHGGLRKECCERAILDAPVGDTL